MIKKILALAAVVLLAAAAPAHAGEGYADEDSLTCNGPLARGAEVTATARTFEPGSTVTFTFLSAPVPLGTAEADDAGVAVKVVTIPRDATPGNHSIQASGTGFDGQPLTLKCSANFPGAAGVSGAGTGGTGNIPRTGSSSTVPMTQIALGALAVGGLMVLVANKRRSANAGGREMAGV